MHSHYQRCRSENKLTKSDQARGSGQWHPLLIIFGRLFVNVLYDNSQKEKKKPEA